MEFTLLPYHFNVQPLAIKSDTFNFTIDLSVELESAKKDGITLYL